MKFYIEDIRLRDNGGEAPTIDGCIYVSVGDVYFPAYQWFDYVSVDLDRWIPLILSFAKGHTDSCVLFFVDGPYQLRLDRNNVGDISAVCLENNVVKIKKFPIDFSEFLLSCAKVIGRLATEIYQVDSMNQYKNLISELGKVSKELRSLANF